MRHIRKVNDVEAHWTNNEIQLTFKAGDLGRDGVVIHLDLWIIPYVFEELRKPLKYIADLIGGLLK